MAITDAARPDAEALRRCAVELLSLERELQELEYVRRSDTLERVAEVTRRLGEFSSSEGILARAAAEVGPATPFERVMLSEVADGRMTPLAIWSARSPRGAEAALAQLGTAPVALEYPLLEHEVAARRTCERVTVARAGARTPPLLARVLGWREYVVAALVAGGETIGLLHADAGLAVRELGPVDLEVAERMAEELSGVLERAVLRHTLALHRAELRAATEWLGDRLSQLEDAGASAPLRPRSSAGPRLISALTPRELQVLRLMARGQSNAAIANALVVREGTVKYHVKNILRKLGATNRADAVARFVRGGVAEGER